MSGYELYDSKQGGSGSATGMAIRGARGRITTASTKQVKMNGVPAGEKLEDYFSPGTLHHKLLSEGQVMVHAHAHYEYWGHADDQKKPIIGKLEWGHYYSTLVIFRQAGKDGKNHDAVRPLRYMHILPIVGPVAAACMRIHTRWHAHSHQVAHAFTPGGTCIHTRRHGHAQVWRRLAEFKLVEDVTALDGKYVTAGACIHLLTSDAAYLHTPTPNTRHMTPNYNTQHLTCNT